MTLKHWIDPDPLQTPITDDFRAAVGGHALVAESLIRRGITSPDAARRFLNPALYTPTTPDALPDMAKAVSRLQQAISKGEHILIWGDFDVDGQTSTALLVAALRDVGAKVTYHVPNRFTEGHGVHLPTLKALLKTGINVVLTCDTGISAYDAVAYAQANGVDVVITDHHSLPQTLPPAYAAINPMFLPEGHALRELPGVGTAYKLVEALYAALGQATPRQLLDLVALGIVADVMVQVDDTRYLLQQGLDVLRQSARPGLNALMQRANIMPQALTETDIGFGIAPRLNALGRLQDANPAVELLTTEDNVIIAERINELEGLNQKRKFLTRQVYEAAQEQIARDPSLLKYAALVVVGEGWHTGVVGIVASRLVEDYHCPVLVLSQQGDHISGSARSVAGANIIEAIRSQAHLLHGYGGHNMAAGLSFKADQLPAFRRGLSQTVREMRGISDIQPELSIDAYINLADIDLNFADDIARLAPFGNGNPPLTLATKNVHIKSRRTLGSRGDHLELRIADANGHEQRVLWWFGDIDAIPQGAFDIAYTVRPNVFNGKRQALIEWLDARPAAGQAVTITTERPYAVLDYRHHADPHAQLAMLRQQHPDALIWAEGHAAIQAMPTHSRYDLQPAQTLIVWTVPPDGVTWRAALDVVQPQTVALIGQRPAFTSAKALITHLMGMAKYALNQRDGRINISTMATHTGQSERLIMACANWISAHTELRLWFVTDDVYQVEMAHTSSLPASQVITQQVEGLWRESNAYRDYWLRLSFAD